jgi:hypothetical protein
MGDGVVHRGMGLDGQDRAEDLVLHDRAIAAGIQHRMGAMVWRRLAALSGRWPTEMTSAPLARPSSSKPFGRATCRSLMIAV